MTSKCKTCRKLEKELRAIKNSDWCRVGSKDQQEGRTGALDRAINIIGEKFSPSSEKCKNCGLYPCSDVCEEFRAKDCEKFQPEDEIELDKDILIVKLAEEWWKELKDWQKQFIFMEKDK